MITVYAVSEEWSITNKGFVRTKYLGVDYNGAAIDLEKKKNVHNLGAKNYESLPKYANSFSCAMIPFKRGEIAKATSPVKLFAYMAAGLPTVCTRDLQECKGYEFVLKNHTCIVHILFKHTPIAAFTFYPK